MTRLRSVAALAVLLLAPASAFAQPVAGTPGRIEISGGVVWTGGYDAGSGDATESANSSTGGAPLILFRTTSRVPAVTGFDARAAFHFDSRLAAEGLFQVSKPELRVKTADDFENAAATQVVGGLSSYVFGGSLVYHFGSGKVVPFVLGGGAYLRLLDEDNADVVTGNEFHGGGGVKVWFSEGPSQLGLRVDAQLSSRSRSPGFEETKRVLPAVSAGLTYRF